MEDALAKRSDTFTQDLSSLKQATKLRVIRAGCGGRFPGFSWVVLDEGKTSKYIFCDDYGCRDIRSCQFFHHNELSELHLGGLPIHVCLIPVFQIPP